MINEMEPQKKVEEKIEKDKRLISRFLENALVEEYEVTASFFGKIVWPMFSVFIALFFYPEISSLLEQLSKNLARTTKVVFAGVEIEITANSLRSSDLSAYRIIEELSREEILFILERGEVPLETTSSAFVPEEIKLLERLVEKNIVTSTSLPDSSTQPDTIVRVELTDFGIRVYGELQSIIINFVEGLPSEEAL